jgi:hypothetical protein
VVVDLIQAVVKMSLENLNSDRTHHKLIFYLPCVLCELKTSSRVNPASSVVKTTLKN